MHINTVKGRFVYFPFLTDLSEIETVVLYHINIG